MKEVYENPEMEIVEFDIEDVITTSDPNNPNIGDGGNED